MAASSLPCKGLAGWGRVPSAPGSRGGQRLGGWRRDFELAILPAGAGAARGDREQVARGVDVSAELRLELLDDGLHLEQRGLPLGAGILARVIRDHALDALAVHELEVPEARLGAREEQQAERGRHDMVGETHAPTLNQPGGTAKVAGAASREAELYGGGGARAASF